MILQMQKILLDTDIGSDIDDALCLAYLLAQNECELLGITTVSGEVEKRAMLASALCNQAKKDIPIHLGIEKPLLVRQKQPLAPQFNRVSNWSYEKNYSKCEAVEFLRNTIHNNPREITLLAIGPMTNIAALFSIDDEIPYLLKELVMMCGRFENKIPNAPLAEWNSWCDPHAASIVYNSPVKISRSVGLDVTLKLVMDKKEMIERFSADILKPVVDFSGAWFEKTDKMIFHDPLAAAVIFDENICRFKKGTVDVELKSERLMGLTYWEENNEEGRHLIAGEVEANRFFNHYFGVIDKYSGAKE